MTQRLDEVLSAMTPYLDVRSVGEFSLTHITIRRKLLLFVNSEIFLTTLSSKDLAAIQFNILRSASAHHAGSISGRHKARDLTEVDQEFVTY